MAISHLKIPKFSKITLQDIEINKYNITFVRDLKIYHYN